MKKVVSIFLLYFLFILQSNGQSHFFKNADSETIAENHETIAILPFLTRVTLRPDQMKTLSSGELASLEKQEGESIQNAISGWFREHAEKGTLAVKVQDPGITNRKLNAAGINLENYPDFNPAHLAAVLGVDAIVTGNYETNQPLAAYSQGSNKALPKIPQETSLAFINLMIYNAEDGELLVQFHNGIYGSKASLNEGVIHALLKKISRKMVYTNT
ncbi:hypothetical protein [Cyclobacterium jeungdonense]|uniref:Uncharacterized protein n=1 Tax=Cyclobacterium jeungdonense TaxID=708087 RepID=A0ABT8C8L0_9BACT|nr:hypothetical protein [Cyclobacterium jeungdonense]MDN3688095.1 hypothetical protein [Cyclobacterium jeungdonense]